MSLLGALAATACGRNNNPSTELVGDNTVKESYIVVLKQQPVEDNVQAISAARLSSQNNLPVDKKVVIEAMNFSLAVRHEAEVKRTFSAALRGGVYKMTEAQAKRLATDNSVAYVEKDQTIHIEAVRSNATWGLDRIDQANLPLDHNYNYVDNGTTVNAYIIDTGILFTHQEFGGRAVSGTDLVDKDSDATDCNGHGTHVAGTIGSNTYGVARNVKLIGVRVLDCEGSGQVSDVVAGIDWVAQNHVAPSVANMSLGGPTSQAIDDAVSAAVQSGVTFVVAGGNENVSACNSSPARVPSAITVGATNISDQRSSFSNFGTCVDVFAPGEDITSTWIGSNTATNTISGTSMATPHVVGVAALYLSQHPSATPAQVSAAITAGAVSGKLSGIGTGSPNLLLDTMFINGGSDPGPVNPPPPPPVDPGSGVVQLSNGVALPGLSGAKNGEALFALQVPAQASQLTFDISGGSGDVDLYVKFGDKPSSSSYDCRPYKSGNVENCTIAAPSAGTYYVMLRGYAAYSGVSLRAAFTAASPSPNSPCSDCDRQSGELKSKGATFTSANFQSSAGQIQVYLQGPDASDFDLYLYKQQGSSFVKVASSEKLKSAEQISYQAAAGTYQIRVVSYSGTGKFDLYKKLP